ncbi:MAG: hypothetical protein M3R51_05260 [Candidatus Eremiobacteraeota bacterium]|nr:hypothetical protein [Candidatus Eremiobacteraeota bacterium]
MNKRPSSTVFAMPGTGHSRTLGRIINAAIAILDDFGTLTADGLCVEATKRVLVLATTTKKWFYSK